MHSMQASQVHSPDSISSTLHRLATVLDEINEEWEERLQAVADFQVSRKE